MLGSEEGSVGAIHKEPRLSVPKICHEVPSSPRREPDCLPGRRRPHGRDPDVGHPLDYGGPCRRPAPNGALNDVRLTECIAAGRSGPESILHDIEGVARVSVFRVVSVSAARTREDRIPGLVAYREPGDSRSGEYSAIRPARYFNGCGHGGRSCRSSMAVTMNRALSTRTIQAVPNLGCFSGGASLPLRTMSVSGRPDGPSP